MATKNGNVIHSIYWRMVSVPYVLVTFVITEVLLQLERLGLFRNLPYGLQFSGTWLFVAVLLPVPFICHWMRSIYFSRWHWPTSFGLGLFASSITVIAVIILHLVAKSLNFGQGWLF